MTRWLIVNGKNVESTFSDADAARNLFGLLKPFNSLTYRRELFREESYSVSGLDRDFVLHEGFGWMAQYKQEGTTGTWNLIQTGDAWKFQATIRIPE